MSAVVSWLGMWAGSILALTSLFIGFFDSTSWQGRAMSASGLIAGVIIVAVCAVRVWED